MKEELDPPSLPSTSAAARLAALRPGIESFNLLQKIGFFFLVFFIYFSFGRLLDFVLGGLHLPLIVSLFAFAGMVLSGGIRRVLYSRVGQLLTGFTIWLLICTPFSFWRGGTVEMLTGTWSKSFLIAITALGLIRTVKEVRQIVFVIGLGTTTIVILCFFFHTAVEEWRWALPIGYLSNPNDLAQLLLAGIPFLTLMVVLPSSAPIFKIIGIGGAIGSLYVIGATGSRGALIAGFIVGLIFFWRSSLGTKLKLVVSGAVSLTMLTLLLPGAVFSRLKTISGAPQQVTTQSLGAAVESRAARLELLKQSLHLTLRYPVFGVGPGQFQVASNKLSGSKGERSIWRETHNTFTQISSETGIAGLLLYCAIIMVCLRGIMTVSARYRNKPAYFETYAIAFALYLSLVSFVITCFFSSMAYQMYFPVLAVICASFTTAVKTWEAQMAGKDDPVPEKPAESAILQPRPRRPRQLTYY